jgi:hypothetical protein
MADRQDMIIKTLINYNLHNTIIEKLHEYTDLKEEIIWMFNWKQPMSYH